MNIYFPTEITTESGCEPSIFDELTKIVPGHHIPISRRVHLDNYYRGVQQVVRSMIPEASLKILQKIEDLDDQKSKKIFFKSFWENTPVIQNKFHAEPEGTTLTISTICKASHTREVGRFICDYFTKWILPGKNVSLSYVHSVVFEFAESKGRSFFFHEMFIQIEDKKSLQSIENNLPDLINEMRVNILAVRHARRVLSVGNLTEEQKKIIIQENISELLDLPSKGYDHNLFEQMQHFLMKVSSEQKIIDIKANLSPLLDLKPQIFERDLFNEIQRFILPATKDFTSNRMLSYVTRIISYSYLLRKWGSHAFISNPAERFAITKIFRTKINDGGVKKKVIGILAGINYSIDTEIFDERHLLASVASLVPEGIVMEDSIINNKREHTGTRILYLEIEKIDAAFTKAEIQLLQNSLTKELLSRVESISNTIFMPRNEEEILRNILTLNNQLRFPTDLPQVMINYLSQETSRLVFTVILVRIEHPDSPPITLRHPDYKKKIYIKEKEEKTVGVIRKTMSKKAYILEVFCQKKKYLRKDFSVDLTRARKDVYQFISAIAGEVRDFNGGMISKQNDVLIELKRQLLQNGVTEDFLIENFFYSFTPRFMQCILPPIALKHSFLLFGEALEHDFNDCIYFIKTITWEHYFIITVATINQSFKQFIEEKITHLDFDPSSFCVSSTNVHDVPTLSYILNFSDPLQSEQLLKTLVEGIKEWKKSFS